MRRLLLLCALAALLLPAAAVAGKKIAHTGKVLGDDNSRITLRVTVNKGKPTRVGAIRARGLDVRCDGRPYDGFSFSVLGSVPVNGKGTFRARIPSQANPEEKLRMTGKVLKRGRRTVGNLKTSAFTLDPDDGPAVACQMPKQRFSTRKR